MTIRFNLRHGLGSGLGHGLNGDERNPVTTPLVSGLNTAAALRAAMGLPAGKDPQSLYTCTEAASPVVNHISAPTANMDSIVGTGPIAFQTPGASPLLFDVGVTIEYNSGDYIRCSDIAENDGGAGSLAFLQVCKINDNTGTGARQLSGKRQSGAVFPGYQYLEPTGGTAMIRWGDGVTAIDLDTAVETPVSWVGYLGVIDRVANEVRFFSSFAPAVTASAVALGSISSPLVRYSLVQNGSEMGHTSFLLAVWTGTNAEGMTQEHLNNLMYFLHLESF